MTSISFDVSKSVNNDITVLCHHKGKKFTLTESVQC